MNNMPADKNRRVLVIDDNRAIHGDFRKILSPATAAALDATEEAVFGPPTEAIQQARFDVDSAYQGQEGVLLVKSALEAGLPYAMAFVDVRMPPGWDGVETTRKIWEIDPNLQVVLCTAYSDYSWGAMFEKLGHRDGLLILKKPFDALEAFQLAHALTEKWWLHRQSLRKMEELESMVGERTRELQQSNHAFQAEVAEHTRAETALRESEARTRLLVKSSGIGLWDWDLVTNQVFFSVEWKSQIGYADAELPSRFEEWESRLHPEDREPTLAAVEDYRQGRRADYQVEFRLRHKDGSWRHIEAIAVNRLDEAAIGGIVVNYRDVTERKHAEAALRASEERLRYFVENAQDIIYYCDTAGHFTYVNPTAARVMQFEERDLIGRHFVTLIRGDYQKTAAEFYQRQIIERTPTTYLEFPSITKSGQTVWIGQHVQLVYQHGRVVAVHAIARDISRQKDAEDRLRRSEARYRSLIQGAAYGI